MGEKNRIRLKGYGRWTGTAKIIRKMRPQTIFFCISGKLDNHSA
jgi:hypothetical protein